MMVAKFSSPKINGDSFFFYMRMFWLAKKKEVKKEGR